ILFGCNTINKKANAQTPTQVDTNSDIKAAPAYDLNKPDKKWELPAELYEISGNAWIDNDHLLAIEDLHPNLYLLNLKNDNAVIEKTINFQKDPSGKKIDIEDVAIANNVVYALWSHGGVYKINDWKDDKPGVKEVTTFLGKENNTEGICFDPVTNNLLIACKNDDNEENGKKSTRAVYEYSIAADSLLPKPFMMIYKKDIAKFVGEKEDFYPSAIAVHPVTHDIYMLSTKGTKCMATFTHDGVLKQFQLMNKDLFLQPEGLCFAPDGTLYISSEGKNGSKALLYRFKMN
ncbi:MAG: hypothetical protein ABI091_23655, partial [Ferruginibacter sp.]